MPGLRISVEWEGLSALESRISSIGQETVQNVEKNMGELGHDAHEVMQEATPVRTGRLQQGDTLAVGGMSFEIYNEVYYAGWVNSGHMTPAGWHRRRGYVPAKRRSHVEGREFLEAGVEFGMENILEYLARSLAD